MHIIKNNLFFVIIICIFAACNKQKVTKNANYKADSIAMFNNYDKLYEINPNNIKKVHSLYMKENDSILLGINHQLYSNYLYKNNKFDSAYYYLVLANNYFKNNNRKKFFNSIQKIALTNRIELLTHSKIELDKLKNISFDNEKIKQLYIQVYNLPLIKQADSTRYEKEINNLITIYSKDKNAIKQSNLIENYLTIEINKYLLKKLNYSKIIDQSTKRINELIKENKENDDLFFTNLFYNIYAKIYTNDATINEYFALYKQNLNLAPTKETEVLYYYLKGRKFQKTPLNDSVLYNFSKALQISRETDNFIYEQQILQHLITLNNLKTKQYTNEFIKINDSLLTYKNYVNDFIFATNSNFLKLKSEQQTIQKQNLSITAFTFILLFSIIVYYIIYRNIKIKQLAKKRSEYLDEKARMYKYLIEIKEQMDASILIENNKTKQLINDNTITKIDELLVYFNEKEVDLDKFQEKIKKIEDESRNISHIISATNYKIVDITYIINNIKKQYADLIKIETFIDNSLVLNNLEFKTLVRIILFTNKFIDKLKYKEELTCFISIYQQNEKIIYKIWINKPIELSEDQHTFFNDRLIKYELIKENNESILLIYVS